MKFNTILVTGFCLILFFSIPSSVFSAESPADIILLTEDFPPFSFKQNDILQGISVELILRMYEKIRIPLTAEEIKLQPWARGYRSLISDKDVCLFSTARTRERESLFKWVGPISTSKIVLTAKKGRGIIIRTIDDVKKYRVGVVREDVAEEILLASGMDEKNIDETPCQTVNIRQLNMGRLDMTAYDIRATEWIIDSLGYDRKQFETVFVLQENELFYAFNKKVEDSVIHALQMAFDAVKSSTEYQAILRAYDR